MCIILCLLSPDDVLYVVLELASKMKYAVCKLDDELLDYWEREVLSLCCKGFFTEVIDSS